MSDWWDDAACATEDPAWFFSEYAGTAAIAKMICADCPVRENCLQFALDSGCTDGIYGGLTADERRRIRSSKSRIYYRQAPAPEVTPLRRMRGREGRRNR